MYNYGPCTCIIRAGHLEVVKYLIEEQGCSAAGCIDKNGRIPLHDACGWVLYLLILLEHCRLWLLLICIIFINIAMFSLGPFSIAPMTLNQFIFEVATPMVDVVTTKSCPPAMHAILVLIFLGRSGWQIHVLSSIPNSTPCNQICWSDWFICLSYITMNAQPMIKCLFSPPSIPHYKAWPPTGSEVSHRGTGMFCWMHWQQWANSTSSCLSVS